MQTSRERHHAARTTPQQIAQLSATLQNIHGSSGPMAGSLGRRASTTAFGVVSGTGNQGPHSLAHVMKTVLHEAGLRHGHNPLSLLRTPAAPEPLRALRMLHEHLMQRGDDWRNETRPERMQFHDRYARNFATASNPALPQDTRLSALRNLLELNPATTTRLTEGTAAHEHMRGKGENRRVAVEDIIAAYDRLAAGEPIDPEFLVRLRTVDPSGNSAVTDIQVQRMFDALLAYAGGVDVPSDSGEQTRSPGHTMSTSDRRSGGESSTMGAGP
ncbi:MAG: hypothetical protein MUE98_04770, partial [Rhodobacteraceae bacterium]|nr:hypothetical protein [Paracoccaceae bacterium]